MNNMNISNEELARKLKDPKYYLENFTKIKGKTPGLKPFILNEAQKHLFNTIRKESRICILKSRQLGFSTAVTGYLYHYTITTPGVTTALIGYNSDLTSELLDKVKTFYRSTPDALKPTIHYNSKHEISFPKLDSKIIVLPSTENVGRGYTLNAALVTELSAWEKAEEKMMVLEASVPIDGKIIVESTPRGTGNLYHKMWMSENGYAKNMYGWWWGYTEEEIEIIRHRMNNPQKFAQEYELEFLTSGRPVFDPLQIRNQRKNILKVGDLNDGYVVNDDGGLRIYKEPEAGSPYVVGVDVSEGVYGGDYSVVTILNRSTGEEVAFYRGLCPPDVLGEMLNRWGRKYNDALMVVEVNNHGLVTITVLKQLLYPSLYFRPAKFETLSSSWSDKIGWRTSRVTRPILIDDLAQMIRDKEIIIHSKEILDEMATFVYDAANNMVPQDSYHDDTIFSLGICCQGFKVICDRPLDQLDYMEHLPTSYNY
jgi:hypothetical protein